MARPAELHRPGRAGAANQSTVSRSSRSPYHSCRFARPPLDRRNPPALRLRRDRRTQWGRRPYDTPSSPQRRPFPQSCRKITSSAVAGRFRVTLPAPGSSTPAPPASTTVGTRVCPRSQPACGCSPYTPATRSKTSHRWAGNWRKPSRCRRTHSPDHLPAPPLCRRHHAPGRRGISGHHRVQATRVAAASAPTRPRTPTDGKPRPVDPGRSPACHRPADRHIRRRAG